MLRALTVITALLMSKLALAQGAPARVDRVARMIERGAVYRARGDAVSALAYYRDAISVAPRRPEGYVALGELYMALDEPKRALEVYEAGARSAGRGEALWLGFARALSATGQHERALEALRSLRRTDPESAQGLAALATALEARGAFLEGLSVRRARLALLERDHAQADAALQERTQVRALEYLLGAAERSRTREGCAGESSSVRRALARCP